MNSHRISLSDMKYLESFKADITYMNVFIYSYMLSYGSVLVRKFNNKEKYIANGVNINILLIFSLIIIIAINT